MATDANGVFQTLRSATGLTVSSAESAPAAAVADANAQRALRSIQVRVKTLTTTGAPTAVTLRIYALVAGGELVVLDDVVVPMTSNAHAEPKVLLTYRDVYAQALSVRLQSFTAGSTPNMTEITVQYREVDD